MLKICFYHSIVYNAEHFIPIKLSIIKLLPNACLVNLYQHLPRFTAALPVPPITGDEPAPAPTTAAPAPTSTAAAPTTAAPAPAADAGPELKPDFGFEIKSRQSQSGSSSGGASVSSTGASQGSVATTLDLSTDGFRLDLGSVGNSGVSGSGVSLGDGGFQQKTQTESGEPTRRAGRESVFEDC